MGKVAFVFSGQGAQHPGMGKELAENYPEARAVFDAADALRPGTSGQCFSGTEEELRDTANTQPCMFAMELGTARALESRGVEPRCVAGFSLGELAALTFAGVFPLETGFKLVCKRGLLMASAASGLDSGMVAVLKLPDEKVEELCGRFMDVYPVNYNAPGQVAVSGLRDELEEFAKLVKEAGGRAVPLNVSGAFHCQFMAEASLGFGALLQQETMAEPRVTVYSDMTGRPYDGDPRKLLARQIMSPVKWRTIVENMRDSGVDTFIEIGPGGTLCGLIRKTVKDARTFRVEDSETLEKTVREVVGL